MKNRQRHLPRSRTDEVGGDLPADPYQEKGKPGAQASCPDCGAVFRRGRWAWGEASAKAQAHLCPACLRTREQAPAGYVYLGGSFLADHKEELLHLLKNEEALEKSRHPLQRVMQLRDKGTEVEVTTTDVHLARRLGEALHHAYQGTLAMRNTPGEYSVRVYWKRAS